jgi:phage/plasmid-like protein (TIGR03299 family)
MAHIIEQYADGTYSFVEDGREGLAWHQLGTAYDRPLTAEEAIKGCRADYFVEPRTMGNLTVEQVEAIQRGEPVVIDPTQLVENFRAVTREDNNCTLGVVKNRYEVVQNTKAFDFIDFLTTGELGQKATIDAAGVLGKGERIFITAKFHDSIKIPGDDTLDMYAVFTNSFDGTSPVCCMITPIRVVCNNTLNMAFGDNTGRFNFRHTKSIHGKIAINDENIRNATSCLNILDLYTKHLKDGVERLGNIELTEDKIDRIVKTALVSTDDDRKLLIKHNYNIMNDDFSQRFRNRVDLFKHNIYGGIGQSTGPKKSGLWLVNGMTTTFQNGIAASGATKLTTKFNNLMTGRYYDVLNKTNELVLAA